MSDFNNLIDFLNPYRNQGGNGVNLMEYQFIRIDEDFLNENQDVTASNLTKVIKYKEEAPFSNPFTEIKTSLPLFVDNSEAKIKYYFQKNIDNQLKYISVENLVDFDESQDELYESLNDTTFERIADQDILYYNIEQHSLYVYNEVLKKVELSVRKTLQYNPKELGGLSNGTYYVDYTNAKGYTNSYLDGVLGRFSGEFSAIDLLRRKVEVNLNPKPGKLYRFPDFQISKNQVIAYYDYDMIENDDNEVDPVVENYAIRLKFIDPEGFLGFMMEVYFLNGVSILNTSEGSCNRKADFSKKYILLIKELLEKSKEDITKKLAYLYYVPQELFEQNFGRENIGEAYLWNLIQEAAEIPLTNIFGVNKEDIVLKLLTAIKLNQGDEYYQDEAKNNQFLEQLLLRRTKDKESILNKLIQKLDGEQFQKFIYFVWSVWKNSSYAMPRQ